eukprot:2385749-Amphidinium_carterae.1
MKVVFALSLCAALEASASQPKVAALPGTHSCNRRLPAHAALNLVKLSPRQVVRHGIPTALGP